MHYRSILANLVLMLAAASAIAQPGATRSPAALAAPNAVVAPPLPAECASVAASVSELPDDVDLVVVVEHCNELRSTPWGAAVGKLLGDANLMDKLNSAWDGLAELLGWDRAETFDRLLGQR